MGKQTRIFLIIALAVIAVAGYLFYLWYYQSLPQTGISLFQTVPEPKPGDTILVFSPHPDDETVAAGGYIKTATQNRADVWIVLVTDGDKHHLKSLRYAEFIKATGILGVNPKHLIFLNYPDGKLNKKNPDIVKNDLRNVIEKVKPDVIFIPHPKDAHHDHSTTGKYVESVVSELKYQAQIYYYLVHYYHYPLPEGLKTDMNLLPPIRLLEFSKKWLSFPLTPEVENAKLEATLQYKTQLKFPPLKYLLEGLVRKNELFAASN